MNEPTTERSIFLFPDPEPPEGGYGWWEVRVPITERFRDALAHKDPLAWQTLIETCQQIIDRTGL